MAFDDIIQLSFTPLEYQQLICLLEANIPKGKKGSIAFWDILLLLEKNKSDVKLGK